MKKLFVVLITLWSMLSCGSDVVIPPVPPPDCSPVLKKVTFEWDYASPQIVDGFRLYQIADGATALLLSTFLGDKARMGSVQLPISGCLCYSFDATAFKGSVESAHSAPAQLCNAKTAYNSNRTLSILVEDITE